MAYEHPINRALIRHQLLLGGERELVGGSILLSVVAGFLIMVYSLNLLALALVVLFQLSLIAVCRTLAKRDPHALSVFLRHTGFRDRYPPRSIPMRAVR